MQTKRSLGIGLAFLLPFLAGTAGVAGGNTQNESFSKAKKLLHQEVFVNHRETFYCGCRFDEHKHIDFSTCGYKPKGTSKRVGRIEWDHIVPAEAFGQSFVEWREGHPDCVDNKGKAFKGRKCAERTNQTYRLMQADLYNLMPAEGEVNMLRSDFSMAMLPGAGGEFGGCKLKIQDRKIEPRPEVRGDIARVYMYMEQAYPGHGIVSEKNRKLYEAWAKEDPVDAWECERVRKTEALQGNKNEIVEQECKARGL